MTLTASSCTACIEGGVEIVGHLQVLRVARLGPVHHDPRDRAAPAVSTTMVSNCSSRSPGVPSWYYCSAMLTISANDRQEASAHTSAAFRGLGPDLHAADIS